MAKSKKEEQRFLGQMPLPSSRKRYRIVKKIWNGLNRRITTDSGGLSHMKMMSTAEYPYLIPAVDMTTDKFDWSTPEDAVNLGVFGFENFLIIIYRIGAIIYCCYKKGGNESTCELNTDADGDNRQRCVVQFNVLDDISNPLESGITKKLIILPDKKTIDFYIDKDNFAAADLEESTVKFTNITAASKDTSGDNPVVSFVECDASSITVKLTNLDEEYDGKIRVVDWYVAIIDEKYPSNIYKREKLGDKVSEGSKIKFTDLEEGRAYKIWAEISNIEDSPNINAVGCFIANEDGKNMSGGEFELSDSEYLKNVLKADRRYIYQNSVTGNCYEWYRDNEAEIAMWQDYVPATFPSLDYATVSHGRLFGVGNGKLFASGFNDYSNWCFDTADEYNESNAWYSGSQSNTKADGEFTGITSYQGHVLAFKKDISYEVYNTKNPFRIIDIYGDGAVDNRSIQEVNGSLFFVSRGNVCLYTGSMPKSISYNLKLKEITADDVVVSGTDGRNYYLWIALYSGKDAKNNNIWKETLYVYDTHCGQWSVREITEKSSFPPVGIASNDSGIYFLHESGDLQKLGNTFASDWEFETDFMTNESLDIEHLKKIQLRAFVDEGASFNIQAIYDDGEDQDLFETNKKDGEMVARAVLRKSASYGVKLRFFGNGYVRFYNLELIYENGGEVNVTI